jgi:valyl-tRNA synthetase
VQIANGNEAQQRGTRRTLIRVLETTLRLAHPFIPFITEELWQKAAPLAGKKGESIMVAPFPKSEPAKVDEKIEIEVALWKEQVEATRNLRSTNNISPAEKLVLYVQPKQAHTAWQHAPWAALGKLSEIRIGEVPHGTLAASTATSNGTLSLVLPTVDKEAERARLGKEIARLESQIQVAREKLGNSSFVDRAPAHVVDEMKKRLAEHEAKHSDMRSQLGKLG